ncbi:MAG: hypothetical protein MZU79_06880 [Anaerotruncus sp.]|nr:hypothetical protein [Anaerotruncus sp.]
MGQRGGHSDNRLSGLVVAPDHGPQKTRQAGGETGDRREQGSVTGTMIWSRVSSRSTMMPLRQALQTLW